MKDKTIQILNGKWVTIMRELHLVIIDLNLDFDLTELAIRIFCVLDQLPNPSFGDAIDVRKNVHLLRNLLTDQVVKCLLLRMLVA
jgi:hypothetical protein